jgi:threonine synthase
VPTGNFGNIFAAFCARQMGLPIKHLEISTNKNDILTRFFETGTMQSGEAFATLSPSMDIQISSNFERLLFNIYDGDAAAVRGLMSDLNSAKSFTIADTPLKKAQSIFSALKVDEETTIATIKRVYEETSELIDPHTAVGVHAARELRTDDAIPMVTLSTAHPAKFPEPVAQATGQHPELPEHMADLFEREEKYDILPHNLEVLKQYIKDKIAS